MKTLLLFLVGYFYLPLSNASVYHIYINEKFEVVQNLKYNGKDLEAKFQITYFNSVTKIKRHFEVIKTDRNLKNYFLADYLLIERTSGSIKYYPLGWVTDDIKEKDIKDNCKVIVSGEVASVIPE